MNETEQQAEKSHPDQVRHLDGSGRHTDQMPGRERLHIHRHEPDRAQADGASALPEEPAKAISSPTPVARYATALPVTSLMPRCRAKPGPARAAMTSAEPVRGCHMGITSVRNVRGDQNRHRRNEQGVPPT